MSAAATLGQALHPFDPSMLRDENGESGLTGHYYNGPVPQGEPVQVRTDRTVNFNWIFALPHPALMPTVSALSGRVLWLCPAQWMAASG